MGGGAPNDRAGNRRVCLGEVVAAHGVRGDVKIKCFTRRPEGIAAYGPVADDAGRRFDIRVRRSDGETAIAALSGVADRNAAEALRGTRLYVDRARLPEPGEDEFLAADLIGIAVSTQSGEAVGVVAAVQDFGAGSILEIIRDGGDTIMVPFSRAAVVAIDPGAGRIVLDPGPAGLLPDPPDDTKDDIWGDAAAAGGSAAGKGRQ